MADIRRDFTKFVKDFPVDIIPHTSDEEMKARNTRNKATMLAAIRQNPRLPNRRLKDDLADITSQTGAARAASQNLSSATNPQRPLTNPVKNNNNQFSQSLHYATKQISQQHIDMTFAEIQSDRIARLTGLVSHFVYWCVFGHINQMPLDEYHLK